MFVEYVHAERGTANIGRAAVQGTKERRGRHVGNALREMNVEVARNAMIVFYASFHERGTEHLIRVNWRCARIYFWMPSGGLNAERGGFRRCDSFVGTAIRHIRSIEG